VALSATRGVTEEATEGLSDFGAINDRTRVTNRDGYINWGARLAVLRANCCRLSLNANAPRCRTLERAYALRKRSLKPGGQAARRPMPAPCSLKASGLRLSTGRVK
jgi:hypothetical protein